ncbi:hypothetical protein INR49_028905 [Caranx melampygus]|nr:hypothetical protein INR49_028905 [Caranx melampygus]
MILARHSSRMSSSFARTPARKNTWGQGNTDSGLLLFEEQSQQLHGGLLEESHYRLIQRVDTGLQVQAKVNEDPVDALLLVFFLLQHKHVVVEELLQLLIGAQDFAMK